MWWAFFFVPPPDFFFLVVPFFRLPAIIILYPFFLSMFIS